MPPQRKKNQTSYRVPEISRHVVDLRGKFSQSQQPQRITLGAVLWATFAGWAEAIARFFARLEDGVGAWWSGRFGWWRRWQARRESRQSERRAQAMLRRFEKQENIFSAVPAQAAGSATVATPETPAVKKHRRDGPSWWQNTLSGSTAFFAHRRVRSLAVFACAGLLLLLPLQAVVLVGNVASAQQAVRDNSNQAMASLQDGAASFANFDSGSALQAFRSANQNFAQIERLLQGSTGALFGLAQYLPTTGRKLRNAEQLLDAGVLLAKVGERMAQVSSATDGDVLQRLADLDAALGDTLPMVQDAVAHLDGLQPGDLPSQVRDQFASLQEKLPKAVRSGHELRLAVRAVGQLFGSTGTKRYVVLLQNSDELRPTGGFISGVALMDMEKGKVKKLDVPAGGPYDFQGYFLKQVQSPKPLWLVNPIWQMQDANYFFDFPTSARKVIWFFEQNQSGYSVDGVIALTPQLIQDLLRITGPLKDEQGNVLVDADTIVETIEQSSQPDDPRPKSFLAALAPQVLQRALGSTEKESLAVVAAVAKSLTSRDMQVYVKDAAVESALRTLGWSGEVRDAPHDYLAIVRTNIAGGKTDLYIDQQVQHTVQAQLDGTLLETLRIRLDHKGQADQNEHGVNNSTFLRVYVPAGATLVSAEGFSPEQFENLYQTPPEGYSADEDVQAVEGQVAIDERSGTRISHESGKTVFGNWVLVRPGTSATLTMRYIVPQRIIDPASGAGVYSLLLQRQSGVAPFAFSSELILPDGWMAEQVQQATPTPSGARLETVVSGDVWYGGIVRE